MGWTSGSFLKGAEVHVCVGVCVCMHAHARDSRNVQYTSGCTFTAVYILRLSSLGGTKPGLKYAPGAGDTNSKAEVTHDQMFT